ncbi:MAG: hypothetical protein H6872_11130 [Methylobacteriaceae bacterium]|nr:hypothetical protein [Methylobacteriaceae bacterium]
MDRGNEDRCGARQAVDEGQRRRRWSEPGRRRGRLSRRKARRAGYVGELDARQVLDRERRDIEAVGRQRDGDGPVRKLFGPISPAVEQGDMRRIRKISQERVGAYADLPRQTREVGRGTSAQYCAWKAIARRRRYPATRCIARHTGISPRNRRANRLPCRCCFRAVLALDTVSQSGAKPKGASGLRQRKADERFDRRGARLPVYPPR